MAKQVQPAYRAFTVIKRGEGQDDFWLAIGAAFKNSDDSYNIILQALPVSGSDGVCKIVLRPPKDDTQQDNGRQDNDRPPDRDRPSRKSGQQRR
jgi:hypothetical protein